MHTKLLLSILCLFAIPSFSQTIEWLETPPINLNLNSSTVGYTMVADPAGNFYMTGYKDNAYGYEDTMGNQYYNKYDAAGNLLFSKEFTGKVTIYDCTTDSNGNVLMMLGYKDSIAFETFGMISINSGLNYLLVKLDSLGTLLWHREIWIPDSFVSSARAVTTDAADNIYIGYDDYFNSYIEKISPTGNTLSFITQQYVRMITSMSVDNQGNLYVTGSCANPGATFANTPAPFPDEFIYNIYIAKYSPSATLQWVKYLDNITCPLPRVVARTPDEVYLSSDLFANYAFDTIIAEGPVSAADTFIAKLNSTGNFQWVREVPGMGSLSNGNRNFLALDDDGNIYFGGSTASTVQWSDSITTSTGAFGNYNAVVLKYNPQGDILMAKAFGGAGGDRIDGIAIGTDGSLLVSGMASGTVAFDDFLVEADPFDNYPFIAKITNETLQTPVISEPLITLYPNPAAAIVFFANAPENVRGSIYNVLGQKVKDFDIQRNEGIAVNDLEKGTYFIQADGAKALKFIKL